MFSWLAKQVIARNPARLPAGDSGPTLRPDPQDVSFRFPGEQPTLAS
jgi:hypothetical protein